MKSQVSRLLLLLLMTTLVEISVQQCTKEGFEAVAQEVVFTSIGSEATSPLDVLINETYYNCLATSKSIGTYASMSVSLTYTLSRAPNTLREIRYVMRCIGGAWIRAAEKNIALKSNATRTDCYRCTVAANNTEYCSSCDNSCTGLNQCYGPNATQCCSYNDDGNCVADCGMNKEGNTTFHCVCSNFWSGNDCDDCSLNCDNGGTTDADCCACQCVQGYEGVTCASDINECASMPCQNGGTCTDGSNSYNCTCIEGFNGPNCENNIDDCASNPCQNGGTCVDDVKSYNCTCVEGFNGTNCDNVIDDCASNPCQNGGTCVDDVNSYNCTCIEGFNGTNCDNAIDDCSSNPCQNGGTCADGINSYNCTCVEGFNGTTCENNIDDCFPNPCQNGGTCAKSFNLTYICICVEGFIGRNCDHNIDDCDSNPCQNRGTCSDLINGFNCTCTSMYFGHNRSEKIPEEENADDDNELSVGAILGIIFGCILAILVLTIIIAAIIFALLRKRNADKINRPKYSTPTAYYKQINEELTWRILQRRGSGLLDDS